MSIGRRIPKGKSLRDFPLIRLAPSRHLPLFITENKAGGIGAYKMIIAWQRRRRVRERPDWTRFADDILVQRPDDGKMSLPVMIGNSCDQYPRRDCSCASACSALKPMRSRAMAAIP